MTLTPIEQGKEQTIYLTGSVGPAIMAHAGRPELGVLAQPETMRYAGHRDAFGPWAVDNGCFAEWLCARGLHRHAAGTCQFDEERFRSICRELAELAEPGDLLFVSAPDRVADAEGTLARWHEWAPVRAELAGALPWAFVAQDGCELDVERLIPWHELVDGAGVLFIGGSDAWKVKGRGKGLTDHVIALIADATRRGVPVHVGRVNSRVRYLSCVEAGARSCDGTFLAFGPSKNVPRLVGFLDAGAELVEAVAA